MVELDLDLASTEGPWRPPTGDRPLDIIEVEATSGEVRTRETGAMLPRTLRDRPVAPGGGGSV